MNFSPQALYEAANELEGEFNDDMEGYKLQAQQVQNIKLIWADAGVRRALSLGSL